MTIIHPPTPLTPEPTEEAEAATNPNAEAAKYRVRAREAEAALATAQARIEQMNRAEVQRLASSGLAHPGDIFTLSGNSASDYISESGAVDAEKVAADVAAILAERPGLRPNAAAVDPSQGLGGHTGRGGPSFSDLLK